MISEGRLNAVRVAITEHIEEQLADLRKKGLTKEQESDLLADLAGDVEDWIDNLEKPDPEDEVEEDEPERED